jgi:hypothetical protein
MITTYEQLADLASCKGEIEFLENKAVRLTSDGNTILLPSTIMLVMPDEYSGTLMSEGFLRYSKIFSSFIKYPEHENLPDVKGKKFYAYTFFHGRDYGHHGEPCATGLLLPVEYVDQRSGEIDKDSSLYKLLQGLEDMEAPQSSERTPYATNPKMTLEEKAATMKR